MTSKRGRKRNNDLPPNRGRDAQRAFRARRDAHLKTLEQRIDELEEENDRFCHALGLPPLFRPPLGKGPTGRDQPYDVDKSRRQKISPNGEFAGSPSSYTSSPELGHSLIAPPISSRATTVEDADPSQRTDAMVENTDLRSEQGHAVATGRSVPPMPDYSDCTPPQLHFPSSAIYSQKVPTSYFPTPLRSAESNFGVRGPRIMRGEARDEIQHDLYGLSQNSNQYLHTIDTRMCPQPRQDQNPIHREWNRPPSDRIHIRRFPQPLHPVQHPGSEVMSVTPSSRSQAYNDDWIHNIDGK